jgi:hypothetical protein
MVCTDIPGREQPDSRSIFQFNNNWLTLCLAYSLIAFWTNISLVVSLVMKHAHTWLDRFHLCVCRITVKIGASEKTMKHTALIVITAALLIQQTCLHADEFRLVIYADGREDGGIRQGAKTNDNQDSPGDIFVFDQKLLDEDGKTVIGRNAGYCIRTDPGAPDFSSTDHPDLPDDPENNYGQCTWSIVFGAESGYQGSIVVSGRESELGTSVLPIVGGTDDFFDVPGVLYTKPISQKDGGMLFRQELVFTRPIRGN